MPAFTSASDWDGQKASVHLPSRLRRRKRSAPRIAVTTRVTVVLRTISRSSVCRGTPRLHCTKWHKSSGGEAQKCGNILRKSCFVPLLLPVLNTTLSRTLANSRDTKSQRRFYLTKLSSFKAARKTPAQFIFPGLCQPPPNRRSPGSIRRTTLLSNPKALTDPYPS